MNKYWSISILLLILSGFIAVLSITFADPDLWGHLRFGLDTLESRSIDRLDPYSYLAQGQAWINHEWLAESLFAVSWLAWGASGLILLKIAVGLLACGLLLKAMLAQGLTTVRAGILTLISLFLLLPFTGPVRPQIFTILGFTLILLIVVKAEQSSYRWLWLAPLLFAIWSNLHGGFLAGLGVFGLWVGLHLAWNRRAWKQVIPPALASLVATFLNPYGPVLLVFLSRTATVTRPEISDWKPLLIRSYLGGIYLLTLLVAGFGLIYSRRERNPVLVILFGILAILPLTAVRHLQLFVPAVLVLVSEHIGDAWDRMASSRRTSLDPPGWLIILPVMVVGMLLAVTVKNLRGIRWPDHQTSYPVGTTALLKQSGVSANLAVDFNWGEYVIWHLGPKVKVSMDGRRETVYSNQIYEEHSHFLDGKGDWDALLIGHGTDLALVSKIRATYNLMLLKPDWVVIYEDQASALFAPLNSPLSALLKASAVTFTPPEEDGYFP